MSEDNKKRPHRKQPGSIIDSFLASDDFWYTHSFRLTVFKTPDGHLKFQHGRHKRFKKIIFVPVLSKAHSIDIKREVPGLNAQNVYLACYHCQ